MVHLSKDRYLVGSYFKLKAINFGPYEILKKMNENA